MAIFALKELKKYLKDKRLREVTLTLNPEVAGEIARNKENVRFVERSLRVKLNLIPNPALKIEDISIS